MVSNFFSQHKTIFVHIFVVTVLVAICAWNIYYIVDDFLNDNHLTVVKVENVNETFPFLKDIPITLEFRFDPIIFPELWSRKMGYRMALEKEFFENTSKTIDYFSFNQSYLEDRINSALLFRHLELMDYEMIACILLANGKGNCKKLPKYSQFDWVLQNRTFIESLQGTAWDSLKDRIIASERISEMTLSYFSDVSALIEIDAYTLLTRQLPYHQFHAGMVGSLEWLADIRNWTSAFIGMRLKVQDFTSDRFTIASNKIQPTKIHVNIENIGVYDKTRTTKCTNEPEIFMGPKRNCTSKSYLQSVARKCQCQPFSVQKKARKLSVFEGKNLPFCTSTMYDQCKDRLRVIDEECLPSCITVKNQYSITSAVAEGKYPYCAHLHRYNAEKCSLIAISIGCSSSNYAIYEERIKVTPTQFVAQIGGDLGIYIGLSALGIWQFLISIFHQYTKYKDEATTNANRRLSKRKIAQKTIISALVGDFANETNKADNVGMTSGENEAGALLVNDEQRQRMASLEAKWAIVDDRMESLEVKLASLAEPTATLERTLARLDERMEALETTLRSNDERMEKFMSDILCKMEALKKGITHLDTKET